MANDLERVLAPPVKICEENQICWDIDANKPLEEGACVRCKDLYYDRTVGPEPGQEHYHESTREWQKCPEC